MQNVSQLIEYETRTTGCSRANRSSSCHPERNFPCHPERSRGVWHRRRSTTRSQPDVSTSRCFARHDAEWATRIEGWTEWIIELREFTGADLASVGSIAICFGDPNHLRPGGDGLVFFDNIRLFGPG